MSLYAMQKFLFELNRGSEVQRRYREDREALLKGITELFA